MSSDKSEDPTPRRLRKARESGDIPVSSVLVQAAALLGAILLLPVAVTFAARQFTSQLGRAIAGHQPAPTELAFSVLAASLPLLGTAAAAALAIATVQTGAAFAPGRITPDLKHINPAEGWKKLWSLDRAVQVLRALATAALLGWLCASVLSEHAPSWVATTGDPRAAAALAGALGMRLLWLALGISAVTGAIDALIVRRSWLERNRMSKDEVKREYRESEGDPQLKQERRRTHQEMLDNASVLALQDATVLIVNPTHLATALRYDPDDDRAPELVARGEGPLAERLIQAAKAYGIPIVRDIPIAHALWQLELGQEIPEELYEAVATILKEVWEEEARERGE